MVLTYRHTRLGCYLGFATQAVVVNLPPLLFITFQQEFSISLSQISLIITLNFAIQMLVDFLSAYFVDKIGYRVCIVTAHVMAMLGLLGLTVFPMVMPPYAGLLTATICSAIGGGLLEVLVSPIIEALPSDRKEQDMSLLHSFYCWGYVGVVLLSTAYFLAFGIRHWRFLAVAWAVLPLLNALLFMKTPIKTLQAEGRTMSIGQLASLPVFWLFFLLMVASGASEQAMSQWASLFAEEGLQVSKTVGDLLGPCAFALLMGTSRLLFSRIKMPLEKALLWTGLLCVACYLTAVFSPWPLLSLVGCAVCGFSVGLMWPGTFSLAAQRLPGGGTAMFALLALAGDIGCCAGPSLVGTVSDALLSGSRSAVISLRNNMPFWAHTSLPGIALKIGFLAAILFPIALAAGILKLRKKKHH